MYETVFTKEPREQRNPLHYTVDTARSYGFANTDEGEGFEVWQVADDTIRTRVCCVGVYRKADTSDCPLARE